MPVKIIERAIRRKKKLILDNPFEYPDLYDETDSNRKIKSIACFPVKNTKKSFLIGMIYLENVVSEINERKMVMLSLISAVVATSFENVLNFTLLRKLKENLEVKVSERTRNLEVEQQKRILEEQKYRKKLKVFINKTCHEIRNPLNGILGSISIIEDEKQKNHEIMTNSDKPNIIEVFKQKIDHIIQRHRSIFTKLKDIRECAEHQRTLLNSVLTLQKIESEDFEFEKKPFCLQETLNSVFRMFEGLAEAKNVKLTLTIFGSTIKNGVFLGDEHQLKRVLINLLSLIIFFSFFLLKLVKFNLFLFSKCD